MTQRYIVGKSFNRTFMELKFWTDSTFFHKRRF